MDKVMDIKPKTNDRLEHWNDWLNDMTSRTVSASFLGGKKIQVTTGTKIPVRNESRIVHLTACRQYTGGVFTKDVKIKPQVVTVLTVPYWHLEEL